MDMTLVFATTNKEFCYLPNVEVLLEIDGVYFVTAYDYDSNVFDNMHTYLAQRCDLPERYVFTTYDGGKMQIAWYGGVYIDGYNSEYNIFQTEELPYLTGSRYLGHRVVSISDSLQYQPIRLRRTYIASTRVSEDMLLELIIGVEEDTVIEQLKEMGFTIDTECTFGDTTFKVCTCGGYFPVTVTRNGVTEALRTLFDVERVLKEVV